MLSVLTETYLDPLVLDLAIVPEGLYIDCWEKTLQLRKTRGVIALQSTISGAQMGRSFLLSVLLTWSTL